MHTLLRLTLATAGVALALAPAAGAQTTAKVAGGQTMLQLDRGVAAALQDAGVRVKLLAPARNSASGLTFPVTGGRLDPASLRGAVSHRGGIRLKAGGTKVALRDFRVRVGPRRAWLTAAAGGDRLPVFRLDLGAAEVGADGPLTKTASGIRARLTRGAARALNAAFSTSLFRKGLRIGTVRTEVRLAEAVLGGGATSLAVDPAVADAMAERHIVPGVVGGATAGDAGLSFPITGGKVDATTLAGSVTHAGGISLTRGETRVELTDFTIEIDDTPALSALVGGQRVEILSLDVSAIERAVEGRTIRVSGVVGRLTEDASVALNDAFQTTMFREGATLGTASVAAEVR